MESIVASKIGIVVIGRNEGARLIKCLHSAMSATNSVVYVDSGSTDGSPSAAARLGASVVVLDMAQPFTAARARNEGFSALKAFNPDVHFVQFVDGDCELVPGWIDKALEFMVGQKDVAIACGRRRERYPERSLYNEFCDNEWNTPIGEAAACGGDSLIRVDAFEAVNGFQPTLMAGEEPELCIRLRERGWKIWRLDVEMTRHDAAITRFSQWWIRAVRSGYGFTEVYWLHRHSPFGLWKREVAHAILWGGLLPLVICLGALIHPAALGIALVYPLQVGRIALRGGAGISRSWTNALFIMLAQIAVFQGLIRLVWRRWRGLSIKLIEYKQQRG